MSQLARSVLNPPMVVASLALLLAMGGTGYAATELGRNTVGTAQLKHDAVTSSKVKDRSIGPADLSLTAEGGQPTLRHGQTETGYFSAAGDATNNYVTTAVTFPSRLPARLDTAHVAYQFLTSPPTTACPGPGHAAAGHLCFYEQHMTNAVLFSIYPDGNTGSASSPTSGVTGTKLFWFVKGTPGYGEVDGTWTVAAP